MIEKKTFTEIKNGIVRFVTEVQKQNGNELSLKTLVVVRKMLAGIDQFYEGEAAAMDTFRRITPTQQFRDGSALLTGLANSFNLFIQTPSEERAHLIKNLILSGRMALNVNEKRGAQ